MLETLQIFLRLILALNKLASDDLSEATLKRVPRIVGGYLDEIEHIPYLVNIRRNGRFECGGSLITPKCILTAAHCVKQSEPMDFTVRAGVTYLRDFRNSRGVANIFMPKIYSNRTLDHDIAIFQLKSKLEGENIETIRLADKGPRPGQFVQVSGWGLTSESAYKPSNHMRSVHVRVMAAQECRKLYKDYRNVTTAMFCASIPGYKDACSADSGGPAVVNGKLVGVVSWGRGYECARSESPGVYVNIEKVRPWIENVITKNCY